MKKLDWTAVEADMKRGAGTDDWNQPRARVYIVARMATVENTCKELQEQLTFERAVNARATEFAKSVVAETIRATQETKKRDDQAYADFLANDMLRIIKEMNNERKT